MVNINKLKSMKKTLGKAPSIAEATNNINSPEVAPNFQFLAAQEILIKDNKLDNIEKHIDGRSIRKSRRSGRITLAVTPEFDTALRNIAMKKNILMVEVLEEALELYKKTL